MLDRTEQEYLTAGGIPVYAFPTEHLHSFALSLYVRGGAIYETEHTAGISHLIEHLVFRSINRYMGGSLYKTLDRLGLAVEGVTYREFLQFTVTGAPEHFAMAAHILSLALAPLSLSSEELHTERARVKAEIREEGERTSLDFFTDGILYGEGHPLSRTITGTAKGLDLLSLSRLREEKERLFSRENIFFYLSGGLPDGAVDTLLEETKDYFPLSLGAPDGNLPLPDAYFQRNATVAQKTSEKTVVRLSFDVDTARYTDAELTLLYDVLFGEGEECFFHQALSEKTGMIYSFRGYMDLYRGLGSIGVSYEIPGRHLLPSLRLALDAIRLAKREAGEALPYVRASYTDNAAFLFDDAQALGFNRAYERYILGLPYPTVRHRADAYARVTGERLSAVAEEIFRPENATLTLKSRHADTEALRALLLTL